MIRKSTISVLALAALLGACTSAGGKGPAPVTPTQRWKLEAAPAADQIALAPHAELSPAQQDALRQLAGRFLAGGGEAISLQTPADGGETAVRTGWNARAALESAGVPAGRIKLAPYVAPAPGAPVLASFTSFAAVVHKCGQHWNGVTFTRENDTYEEFGCSTTANMAAQIADPRDIARPRGSDPADAGRRDVVLDKYRKGEVTSAAADDKANGHVATVVQ